MELIFKIVRKMGGEEEKRDKKRERVIEGVTMT
jgi:hypothetical protein